MKKIYFQVNQADISLLRNVGHSTRLVPPSSIFIGLSFISLSVYLFTNMSISLHIACLAFYPYAYVYPFHHQARYPHVCISAHMSTQLFTISLSVCLLLYSIFYKSHYPPVCLCTPLSTYLCLSLPSACHCTNIANRFLPLATPVKLSVSLVISLPV